MKDGETYKEEARLARLVKEMRVAERNLDAPKYASLVNELGVIPSSVLLYEQGVVENMNARQRESQLEAEVDKNLDQRFKPQTNRKRAVDYDKFYRLAQGVDPYDTFSEIPSKRRILLQSGCRNAYVGKGEKVSLEDASDYRVGQMFKNIYQQAEKQKARK